MSHKAVDASVNEHSYGEYGGGNGPGIYSGMLRLGDDAEKEGANVVQEVLSPPHGSAHTLTPTVEVMAAQPPQAMRETL